MANKYAPFDPSPEARAWRQANKKRVRSESPRRKRPTTWMLWLAVAVVAMISLPLGLVAGLLVGYVTSTA